MTNDNGTTRLIPRVRQSITEFLYDEEASIPRGRLLMVGSVMVVLAVLMNIQDAFAGHGSHVSHGSHDSHVSHVSHVSHSSHSNHSNHANHQNATPRPTPAPTPHASHSSYLSTSQAKFTVPEALPGISSPSLNAATFSSVTVHDGAALTVMPIEATGTAATPIPGPAALVMQVPQMPPDTPKL
jgi:hypothetical protein